MAKKITRKTHQIKAEGKTLGRLASEAAALLIGKHKVEFEPNADVGDFVHIVGPEKIKLTGNKINQKIYYRHSGYPGGLNKTKLSQLIEKGKFEEVIKMTIDKMLPKNKLRTARLKRLTFGKVK